VIDAAHSVSAYWYGKHRAASLFGTGPVFGSDAALLLAWMHQGGGKELYRELVQDVLGLDVVAFFAFPMPTQPLGWFRAPVKSLDDLKRVKYRTVGLATELMQGLGAAPAQVPSGDIVTSMQTRRIDAFEFNNPSSDRQLGAADVARHYVLGSYHHANEFFEILFSKRKFESLASEQQAILEHAAEAASTANAALALDRYSRDLSALAHEDGVTVSRAPDDVLAAQLAEWDKAVERFSRDPFFKKVVDSQKGWGKRVGFYHFANAADFRRAYDHVFPGVLKG
jgi:TRAP-type mannitol/chloroaromatic compound transport system substrate-binding protein